MEEVQCPTRLEQSAFGGDFSHSIDEMQWSDSLQKLRLKKEKTLQPTP